MNCTSYHHAGIHVIETAAKVVFAAVLGSIPVPVPGTWCVLYEYQIRGVLLSPTWYIRLHWYQVPGCIRVRSMHAGIHVIEKQQSIELYHHAGIHVIETGAKVVFAAVLGSIPVPVL